ncbi:hypothetical protein ACQP2F_12905 [Actinoplanes sp. CA-030573]|uniref:hypothetical protein n=1 Tax=Actinoplanes sp. CA-030573 TaxID=3239898 RepID=UPI003D90A058
MDSVRNAGRDDLRVRDATSDNFRVGETSSDNLPGGDAGGSNLRVGEAGGSDLRVGEAGGSDLRVRDVGRGNLRDRAARRGAGGGYLLDRRLRIGDRRPEAGVGPGGVVPRAQREIRGQRQADQEQEAAHMPRCRCRHRSPPAGRIVTHR